VKGGGEEVADRDDLEARWNRQGGLTRLRSEVGLLPEAPMMPLLPELEDMVCFWWGVCLRVGGLIGSGKVYWSDWGGEFEVWGWFCC